MTEDNIPMIMCKVHDSNCPRCGRLITDDTPKCLCGQKVAWEDHYNEFCFPYESRCHVVVTGKRRTCNNCGVKIAKETPILEVDNGRMAKTNVCLACMEKLTNMVRNRTW